MNCLDKKELKVDLIVLDKKNQTIANAIGHLFRQYNIMAYAYLYKTSASRVDEIKDVIIDTIVKANEMQLKLIKELLKLMEPEINQIKEEYAKEKLKQQEEQLLKQQKQFIVRMARQGIDVVKIVDITGRSEEEIKAILSEHS